MRSGKIIASSSLGYTVIFADDTTINCPRKKGQDIKDGLPIIGDDVEIDDQDRILRRLPRKSALERPRVANLDIAAIVIAAKQPDFSTFLLDKYLTACSANEVPALICVTKWDLLNDSEKEKINSEIHWYELLGYKVYRLGKSNDNGLQELKEKIDGSMTAFVGQTGAGKSSLANRLDPDFHRPIGRFDESMGRGTHKTKEVAIFRFLKGFLADTPGFSDFKLTIEPSKLSLDFPGYFPYAQDCRFSGCLHNNIKDCAVEKAVREGKLSSESHRNYLKLLAEALANSNKEKKSSHSSYSKGKGR